MYLLHKNAISNDNVKTMYAIFDQYGTKKLIKLNVNLVGFMCCQLKLDSLKIFVETATTIVEPNEK